MLGRSEWLNRDPIGEAGGINLYGFVHNNPTTLVDPDGRIVPLIIAAAVISAVFAEEAANAPTFDDPRGQPKLSLEDRAMAGLAGGVTVGVLGGLGAAANRIGPKIPCPVKPGIGPKIHPGKQGKHLPGHNNFQPGKGEWTHPDPQGLVDRFAGRGSRSGQREWVDTGENVGNYVDPSGNSSPTTRMTIHYGGDGTVHVVPAPPTPPR